MSSAPAVGIDLGTTFSCVAYYNQNKAEVIPDQRGDRLIPSFVYYDPTSGEVHVGKVAYELATNFPANGLRDIKRIIGRRYNDEFLIKYRQSNQTPFSIIQGANNLAVFEITLRGNKIVKTPAEASSEILKYLKNSASSYLNQNITEAVISIPAYFSNAQRKATKEAAELAGLKVLKFITEPTAGAIHYTRDKNINEKLLVFDWGGGTLDVSLIQVNNKSFTVKSVYGDTLLGGRNIDENLFKHFYIPVSRSPIRFIRRLLHECINLKELLTTTNNVTKIMDYIDDDKDLTLSMTRSQFENLNSVIFERIMNIVEVGLSDAAWDKSDVNDIILVGGSSRIPKISEMLQTFFNGKKPKTDLNPDEAVACGASVQAALLKNNLQTFEKYTITEVTPLSLGIASNEQLFCKFIKKNSRLPVSERQSFVTSINDQKTIVITVYEGERKNCAHNNKLGHLSISNLPPGRAEDVEVWIQFDLDEDGILTVTATEEKDPKNKKTLTVTMGEFRLSENKVKISLEEAAKHRLEDDVFEKFVKQRRLMKKRCYHILYDIDKISSRTEKELIKNKCEKFLDDVEDIDYIDEEILKAKFEVLNNSIERVLKKFKLLELTN